jgi:type VI secretion system protein ImpA
MNVIDVAQLLQPASPEQPAGENLERELQLLEIATEPRQDTSGKPHPPRLTEEVIPQAVELLKKSKDLKAAVILLRSLVKTDGFIGLADGMALIRGLLEHFWDDLHPQPEEAGDYFDRIVLLGSITDEYRDGNNASDMQGMLLHDLRRLPFVAAQGIGQFSLRDIKAATGKWRFTLNADAVIPQPGEIEAALQNCNKDELQTLLTALQQTQEHVQTIAVTLTERAPPPNDQESFDQLLQELKEAQDLIKPHLGQTADGTEAADMSNPSELQTADISSHSSDNAVAATGKVRNGGEVIRLIDKICDYYHIHEPSSPVPLLLQRAKRLVNKDFMAILQDIAPTGLPEATVIRGAEQDSTTESS